MVSRILSSTGFGSIHYGQIFPRCALWYHFHVCDDNEVCDAICNGWVVNYRTQWSSNLTMHDIKTPFLSIRHPLSLPSGQGGQNNQEPLFANYGRTDDLVHDCSISIANALEILSHRYEKDRTVLTNYTLRLEHKPKQYVYHLTKHRNPSEWVRAKNIIPSNSHNGTWIKWWHFAENIFNFLRGFFLLATKISLKYFFNGAIKARSVLVQAMGWWRHCFASFNTQWNIATINKCCV